MSEEKVVGSASLFPARKQEAVPQGGTRGIDHPTRKITQGAGIIKGARTNETAGAFQIHSRKTITLAWAP